MKTYVSSNEHYEISRFLFEEAELLDHEDYTQWLALLSDDFTYVVPVKEVRGRNREEYYAGHNYYFKDDRKGLEDRIKRLLHKEGWSSKMHTQTRRFITNIIAFRSDGGDTISVEYNLMLARTEPDIVDSVIITGRRVDQILEGKDGFLLKSRRLYLDQTSVVIYNMYFPI